MLQLSVKHLLGVWCWNAWTPSTLLLSGFEKCLPCDVSHEYDQSWLLPSKQPTINQCQPHFFCCTSIRRGLLVFTSVAVGDVSIEQQVGFNLGSMLSKRIAPLSSTPRSNRKSADHSLENNNLEDRASSILYYQVLLVTFLDFDTACIVIAKSRP